MKKILLFFCAMLALSASALTYNVTVPTGTNACYIVGEFSTWSHIEMTKVDDTHYTIDLAEATEAQKYKYCSGPGWSYVEKDANGNEIADRTYSANDVVEKWNQVYVPSAPVEDPEGDVTIYLEKSTAYAVTYLYAWDGADLGAWPGMAMSETETVGEVEYWKHTFVAPEKAFNIIFTDNAGNQTNDITGVNQTTYYRLNSTKGKTDVTIVTPGEVVEPETLETLVYNVTVPAGTPACHIVGDFNEWTEFVAMTMVDETHYTITLENVTKSMGYKYTCGTDWMYEEDGLGYGENRTWSENDVVNAWKAMPEAPGTLTYNVTVPAGTPACYIVGDFNVWGAFEPMTKVDDTHYTITLDNVTKTMTYKYTCGEDWAYEENRDYGDNRRWSENDVVESWKAIPDGPVVPEDPETLTYTVTVPEGTPACYIAGEMTAWYFMPMEQISETQYTITLMGITKSMKYKYACGEDWAYVEMQADGVTDVVDRTWSESDVVAAWKAIPEDDAVNSILNDNMQVYGANGTLHIAADNTQVAIYNAQGMLVKTAVVDGNATINLARGLYIVNNKKVLVY